MTLQTLDEEFSYTWVQPPAVQFKGKRPEPQPSEETGEARISLGNLEWNEVPLLFFFFVKYDMLIPCDKSC